MILKIGTEYTREGYRDFVKGWKASYAVLTKVIRKGKKATRLEQSLRAKKRLMKHVIGRKDDGTLVFDSPFIEQKFTDLTHDIKLMNAVTATITDEFGVDRGYSARRLATEMTELRAIGKAECKLQEHSGQGLFADDVVNEVVEENNLTVEGS